MMATAQNYGVAAWDCSRTDHDLWNRPKTAVCLSDSARQFMNGTSCQHRWLKHLILCVRISFSVGKHRNHESQWFPYIPMQKTKYVSIYIWYASGKFGNKWTNLRGWLQTTFRFMTHFEWWDGYPWSPQRGNKTNHDVYTVEVVSREYWAPFIISSDQWMSYKIL